MSRATDDLLNLARRLLDEGRPADAAPCLAAILAAVPGCLAAHNLVEKHRLAGNFSEWTGVDARISEADDIFRFFAGHPTSTNPIRDYLADGWRTMAELMSLLEDLGRSLRDSGPFLEFACGYGRFTRHLQRRLPAGGLHVSDVLPGSVEFLRATFGVTGFHSDRRPGQIQWPAHYQTVFVLSLFSHLPRATWADWLARLWEATAPGGVLIFSTHGETAAGRAGVAPGADGFSYFPGSESSVLEAAEYGCTYTTRSFVENAATALRPAPRISYFPAHFWSIQDAFALEK